MRAASGSGGGGGGGAGKRKRKRGGEGDDKADALQGLVRVAFSGLQPGDRQVGGGRRRVTRVLVVS